LGANTPKIAFDTRCRKFGERCHRMNAKTARFSPTQIATMMIKICIDFVPRRATRITDSRHSRV
jgi:5-methylcytosine-specific restriction endonuclease McrBC regulatory subunit McrC